jgi:HSP90 family molecular chaperone
MEEKQFLIVEDYGMGMDREVIERYFLRVGHSYCTSDAFRRSFRFIPTSQFGIGFLSVFAVSDWVTVPADC